VAEQARQPHQSPVNARVQALQAPGSPLSPGGRDGAAALLSLFNSVSAPDSPRALPRHRPPYPPGEYFGHVPGQDTSPPTDGGGGAWGSGGAEKPPERPLSARSMPKHSLAAQAAKNANAMAPPHSTATTQSQSFAGDANID
jgi:hypothetical protein